MPGTRTQSGPQAGIRVLLILASRPCSLRSFNHVRAQFLRFRPQECATIGMGLLLLCLAWFVFVIVPLVSMKPSILLSCSSSSLPGSLFAGLESSIVGSVVILTASECLSRAPTQNRTNPAMMRFPLGSDVLNMRSSRVAACRPGIVHCRFGGDTYGVGVPEAGSHAEPNEPGDYPLSCGF